MVDYRVDTIQINLWKIGLGLVVLFLVASDSVYGKENNYSGNFYITVRAPYPVDISSVEVAKKLAATHCPDLLDIPLDKNLVTNIIGIELLEHLQEDSAFESTFIIKKQDIDCTNFYLEEKVSFMVMKEEDTGKFPNTETNFSDGGFLTHPLSNIKNTKENLSTKSIHLKVNKEIKNLSLYLDKKESDARVKKNFKKNPSDKETNVINKSKLKNIEGENYGLRFNLYSEEY